MKFRVVYADSFVRAVDAHVAYLRGQRVADRVITGWYENLFDKLDGIEDLPYMHPLDEAYTARIGRSTRKVSFGDYIVYYQVDDSSYQIELVGFVHGASRRDANQR